MFMKRRITEIIIHCTATPAGRYYSVNDIRQWHLKRGFSDIGYHYVIDLNGKILLGRSIAKAGAHCKGHNAYSIGICYVGGLDLNYKPCDTRTPAQIDSLHSLVSDLVSTFGPVKVYGHNEFSNKACPCFDVQSEFYHINNPLFVTLKL